MSSTRNVREPEEGALSPRAVGYLKWGTPAIVILLAIVAGSAVGAPGAILALASGALFAVIAAFWSSVRTLFGETPLSGADAYALGAPRAEEEQKRAVVRALKDLEDELAVGKISEDDYKMLKARYRSEGRRLLRILDTEAQPRRAYVETLVAKRLRREGLLVSATAGDLDRVPASESAEEPDREREPAKERAPRGPQRDSDWTVADSPLAIAKRKGIKKRGERDRDSTVADSPVAIKRRKGIKKRDEKDRDSTVAETPLAIKSIVAGGEASAEKSAPKAPPPDEAAIREHRCPSCSTVNDSDASFCKKCGTRLSLEAPPKEAQGDALPAKTSDDEAGA